MLRRRVFWAVDGGLSTPHTSGRARTPMGTQWDDTVPRHVQGASACHLGCTEVLAFLPQKSLPSGMCPFSGYKARDGQSRHKGSVLTSDLELVSASPPPAGISWYDVWWQCWGGELQPPWAAAPVPPSQLSGQLGLLCRRLAGSFPALPQ